MTRRARPQPRDEHVSSPIAALGTASKWRGYMCLIVTELRRCRSRPTPLESPASFCAPRSSCVCSSHARPSPPRPMPTRAPSPSPAVAPPSAWTLLVGTSRAAPPHFSLAFPPLLRPLLFSLLFLLAACSGASTQPPSPTPATTSSSEAVHSGASPLPATTVASPRPPLAGVGFSISGYFSVYHAGVVHGLSACERSSRLNSIAHACVPRSG